jgi:hypothetical protein
VPPTRLACVEELTEQGCYLLQCMSPLLAHNCVRGTAPFRTQLDNNGQTSILARDGYDVNEPERTK